MSSKSPTPGGSRSPSSILHRPIYITLLAILVLIITIWNGLRLYLAIASWKVMAEFDVEPLVLVISGGFWLLIGIPLFVGIWRGTYWGRKFAYLAILGYTSWYWYDRLFLQHAHTNWQFELVVTLVLLFFTVYTLLNCKNYFIQRETHD